MIYQALADNVVLIGGQVNGETGNTTTGKLVAYTAYQFQKFDKIKGTFSKSDIAYAENKQQN